MLQPDEKTDAEENVNEEIAELIEEIVMDEENEINENNLEPELNHKNEDELNHIEDSCEE